MNDITLVFPHQLFSDSPALARGRPVLLVEEYLFFRQFNFHRRKLAYHRATMQHYAADLEKRGFQVETLQSTSAEADARQLGKFLKSKSIKHAHVCDPVDDWLSRRLNTSLAKSHIQATIHPTPMFLNSSSELEQYYAEKGRLFQTDFYIQQRKRLNVLVDAKGKPQGGKWSYDAENRLRYPKNQSPPKLTFPRIGPAMQPAMDYVQQHYSRNYGQLDTTCAYPISHAQALRWLDQFLEQRLAEFGIYEDAIVLDESWLHHSVLTPMLNVGLITPRQVIDRTLEFAQASGNIPLNSLEGFLRQIIGWREFIRAVYQLKGRDERTRNYWSNTRKIPKAFWEASTGIQPLDAVIEKVLRTAYCHHIERLMVLGNFMLLCEFDPDDVYRWFMELFIDAYDWVMVPNVYGMSQFADGGLMATKPYISGSNYLMKMSNAPKGEWQEIWDALFWRFMNKHREFFLQNPRLGMLIKTYDKMSQERRTTLNRCADKFLGGLG